jgi:hypothetical protein
MSPEHLFGQFDRLLEEERAAIRRLDGSRVHDIAAEKADLFLEIRRQVRGRADLAPRFRDVAAGLRRNAVLLAHARDCLRDVLSSFRDLSPSTPYAPSAASASAGLSVRG